MMDRCKLWCCLVSGHAGDCQHDRPHPEIPPPPAEKPWPKMTLGFHLAEAMATLALVRDDLEVFTNYQHSLNNLRDEALRIATEHGFTDSTPLEDIALIHSELSEALEEIRAGSSMTATPMDIDNPGKPCGVPSEMADVIIRVLHFCGKHGIDIQRAVMEKMKYNESRPYKHGKVI